MRKILALVFGIAIGAEAHGSALTIREIKLGSSRAIEIQFDGTPAKGALSVEYIRDIVQFSIQDATVYPARILHSEGSSSSAQSFSKIFAYQYAPNLVRVRISVNGKADQFQGKLKWEQKGQNLVIQFPEIEGVILESKLLEKVLEKTKAPDTAGKTESTLKFKKEKIAGGHEGPSPLRFILAMLLVVGGLGLVLLYVKKSKKSGSQAKKIGDSWISNLLTGSKKDRSVIEVIAVHSLGPKQSITIVRIRDQQFVLGVTEGNIQLITQLEGDEDYNSSVEMLEDPKIVDSLGKIFGEKPKVLPTIFPPVKSPTRSTTFDSHVRTAQALSVRDEIKQRLQGMQGTRN